MLIQRRVDAPGKDNPGMWDKSVGGHVGSGEGYCDAIARELNEELRWGLEKLPVEIVDAFEFESVSKQRDLRFTFVLKELGRMNYPSLRKLHGGICITEPAHSRTYLGRYEGEISAQKEEVEELRWVSKKILEEMMRKEEFTKDFLFLYAKYKSEMFRIGSDTSSIEKSTHAHR